MGLQRQGATCFHVHSSRHQGARAANQTHTRTRRAPALTFLLWRGLIVNTVRHVVHGLPGAHTALAHHGLAHDVGAHVAHALHVGRHGSPVDSGRVRNHRLAAKLHRRMHLSALKVSRRGGRGGSKHGRPWLRHGVENDGTAVAIHLHDARVLKAADERVSALNPGIRDRADLAAVEVTPSTVVKVLVKANDGPGVDKVDEGVANVALVLKVDRQVEKVVCVGEQLVDLLENHLLRVFVGNVAHHDRRAEILFLEDCVNLDLKLGLVALLVAGPVERGDPTDAYLFAVRPRHDVRVRVLGRALRVVLLARSAMAALAGGLSSQPRSPRPRYASRGANAAPSTDPSQGRVVARAD
mmetsp:Transcript_11084/g.35301  ORF Transcript_11084/g.35301 Transcript_11084/m.35301 type:complete len:354 (+) Transcript_11084:83-1144(+)